MKWSVKKEKLFERTEWASSFLLAKRSEFLVIPLQCLFFWYFSCAKKSTWGSTPFGAGFIGVPVRRLHRRWPACMAQSGRFKFNPFWILGVCRIPTGTSKSGMTCCRASSLRRILRMSRPYRQSPRSNYSNFHWSIQRINLQLKRHLRL